MMISFSIAPPEVPHASPQFHRRYRPRPPRTGRQFSLLRRRTTGDAGATSHAAHAGHAGHARDSRDPRNTCDTDNTRGSGNAFDARRWCAARNAARAAHLGAGG
jgi:hypothetical protein